MSDGLDTLLEKIRAEPQIAEHWVRLFLHALEKRDGHLLSELHAMRDRIFGDGGLLLFQTCYSKFLQDDPRLQDALIPLATQLSPDSEIGVILNFFSGCMKICNGENRDGLTDWQHARSHLETHGQKLQQIPQLTELGIFIRLLTPITEEGEAPLPDLKWLDTPPSVTGPEPIFLAACDGKYFERFGQRFIDLMSPLGHVHLHIADPSPDLLKQLQHLAGSDLSITIEESGSWRSAAYYASIRFLQAARIQDQLQNDLIILDIDLESVTGFDQLLKKISDSDIAWFNSGLILPWLNCQAAFLFLRRNEQTGRFLSRLTRQLTRHLKKPDWFLDQTCLLLALQETARNDPEAKLHPLRYLEGEHFEDYFSSSGTREEKTHFRQISDRAIEGLS